MHSFTSQTTKTASEIYSDNSTINSDDVAHLETLDEDKFDQPVRNPQGMVVFSFRRMEQTANAPVPLENLETIEQHCDSVESIGFTQSTGRSSHLTNDILHEDSVRVRKRQMIRKQQSDSNASIHSEPSNDVGKSSQENGAKL